MPLPNPLFESMAFQSNTDRHESDRTHRSTDGDESSAKGLGPRGSGRGPPPTGRDAAAVAAPGPTDALADHAMVRCAHASALCALGKPPRERGRYVGIGSMLLPGPYLEAGVQVGAGAVVRGRHRAGEIIAGAPARTLRMRGDGDWARALDTLPPGRRGRAG